MCCYRETICVAKLGGMLRDIAPFGLRIPAELKEKIHRSAKDNGRSMNSEILARLQASFDPCTNLGQVTTGQLVRELLDRNEPGRITIEIARNGDLP